MKSSLIKKRKNSSGYSEHQQYCHSGLKGHLAGTFLEMRVSEECN